ncbi:MAG: class I SAM-dependent methyltransferase [Planctomycetes bacterium]|nr:class I SAM-dependent methyltransferase [Planctomycetota bacterium]
MNKPLRIPARPSGMIERACRRALLSTLAGLRHGRLRVLEDGSDPLLLGDGGAVVELHVGDPAFWPAAALGGSVGVGEAYTEGLWRSPDLPGLIALFARNRDLLDRVDGGLALLSAPLRLAVHAWHRNSRRGARANIAAHYDLGNAMFAEFLDPTLSYSSCWYDRPETTLDEAAVAKLERVCRLLDLRPGQHLVEIGTGWGGLAIHAARHHGVRVTTTTISAAQREVALERVRAAGLADRVTVLGDDYRDLPRLLAGDPADRLVSVEMVEAIGRRQYPTYLATIRDLLREDGLAVVQAITIPDARFARAAREVDFIKRWIFPGSCIPSLAALLQANASVGGLDLVRQEDFGLHYARTLADWRRRLLGNRERILALGYGESFIRQFEFYFAYCEGGFAERAIGVSHLSLARPRWRPAGA